jgi:hypothetical protein
MMKPKRFVEVNIKNIYTARVITLCPNEYTMAALHRLRRWVNKAILWKEWKGGQG